MDADEMLSKIGFNKDDEDFGIWDEMIKTVVTKEQFENISYKVGELKHE